MALDQEVMAKIADALGVNHEKIGSDTKSQDVEAWDSMGTMAILFALTDNYGVALGPNETGRLQSVQSIIELVRSTVEKS